MLPLWLLSLRACAEKMEIGVNYVPETPNLDRVVEMSALTEALNKAFPDMTPDQYPWPTSHQGGDTGRVRGSWPAPPKTRTSASAAQQALDRIRQAALPSARSQAVSRASSNFSKQQQVVKHCHYGSSYHVVPVKAGIFWICRGNSQESQPCTTVGVSKMYMPQYYKLLLCLLLNWQLLADHI